MAEVAMALLGSGEFDPWSEPVERWLIERSRRPDGTALVLPTAAAHEGEDSFQRWGSKGLEHFASLDLPADVLPLRVREDADRDDLVARLDDASLVFFSGGNPYRLARALDGSAFWTRLQELMAEGLPYAGCSAGVACLTVKTFDSEAEGPDGMWKAGLGFARGVVFGPHWDIVDTWIPGATTFIVSSVEPGDALVGLDEETAMVGDGASWNVIGRQQIHVLEDGTWRSFGAGDRFELPIGLAG
jgi:cyanophycinase